MKAQYDREDDALCLFLSEGPVDHAEEADGVIVHFNRDDVPVMIEILDASDFLARLTRFAVSAKATQPVVV